MKQPPRISETEWEIMNVIWGLELATSQQVIETLLDIDSSWHPNTVKTMLNRLVKKKVLGFRKDGRTYIYRPLVPRGQCISAESTSFLDRVFGGSIEPMLAHFVQEGKLNSKELEELKVLLTKPRKK